MSARRLVIVIVVAVLALACDEAPPTPAEAETDAAYDTDDGEWSGDESGLVEVDCEAEPVVTYDTFGRGFLATYCDGCHGPEVADRKGAPPAVVFDHPDAVSEFADRILVRAVDRGGATPMPPAGGIVPDDLDRLRIWLTCYP
jgi:mono/diheme cytochrome c family protein